MAPAAQPASVDLSTTPSARRPRRASRGVRQRLLEAALIEFAAHGFEGASTRGIAARADAHQPQINYYFDSGRDPTAESVVVAHAEGLVALLIGR